MIKGIGIDIIEIERIVKAVDKNLLIERFFTEAEAADFCGKQRYAHIAGKYAAKEAVAKAMGTGFSGFRWKDIEILKDDRGRPYVNLKGKAYRTARERGIDRVYVAISHSRDYAVAQAIAVSYV